jgi:hypothetical protein
MALRIPMYKKVAGIAAAKQEMKIRKSLSIKIVLLSRDSPPTL